TNVHGKTVLRSSAYKETSFFGSQTKGSCSWSLAMLLWGLARKVGSKTKPFILWIGKEKRKGRRGVL
ncbi:hypothetical protein ACQP3L_35475, partial [Escherichia coli]